MKLTFRQIWPALLLVGLAVIFLGDVWFGGRILFLRDFFAGDSAFRELLGAELRSGKIGLWCSNWQCGTPEAAQPYLGHFYPPNWIFVLPSLEWAARISWTFHFSVAAISAYLLARYWRLAVAPALFAAVGFAFNTCCMAWLEFSHSFCCMVWMPLVFLLVSRVIDNTASEVIEGAVGETRRSALLVFLKNAGWVVALAAVLALQFLASSETFLYSGLLVVGYTIAKWIRSRNGRVCWLSALFLGTAGLLALALAMPQLLLTSELLGFSQQVGEIDPLLDIASAHPRQWLTLLLPFLYGRPGYPDAYWAETISEFANGTFYVGILPLMAACFCWLRPKQVSPTPEARERRFLIWFLVATVAVGLTLAAGKYTPVYAFLHHWIPGLERVKFPTQFFLYVIFALPLLGAIGFQTLLDNKDEERTAQSVYLWRIIAGIFGVFIFGYLVCLFSNSFLIGLMGKPGAVSGTQVNAAMVDYTLAVVFFVAGLALFGWMAFRPGKMHWVQGAIVAVAFIDLCVVSRQVHPTVLSGIYTRSPEALVKKIGTNTQYRLLSSYWDVQQSLYGEQRVEMLDWAREAGATRHTLSAGLPTLTPGGMVMERYNDLLSLMGGGSRPVADKVANMMALRYLVSGAPADQILHNNASRDVMVSECLNYLPRAYVVSQWRVGKTPAATMQIIKSDAFDPHKEAVLEPIKGEPNPPDAPSAFPDDEETVGEISSFVDQSDSVKMNVWLNKRGLLVLGDTWYPGWTVTVDGFKHPIYRANYNFRGVFLEPGSHRVEFEYAPVRFTIGIWICALAVLCCGILIWLSRFAPPSVLTRLLKRRSKRQKVCHW